MIDRVTKVLWEELFPSEFKKRLTDCPVVYLPLGLCEPHGQISALGLDSFKANYICTETAKAAGGIVAPTMGFHIHEIGPSAKFLEDHIGEANPRLTSIPTPIFVHYLLYQLRAFYNAGFQAVLLLSGHGGSYTTDLQWVSDLFTIRFGMTVRYITDFSLVAGRYPGDHAGKYEISSLQFLRPDLIDFSKCDLETEKDGGTFALHPSAKEANREYGETIMSGCVDALTSEVLALKGKLQQPDDQRMLSYRQIEELWMEICRADKEWESLKPRDNQQPVTPSSRWKASEYFKMS